MGLDMFLHHCRCKTRSESKSRLSETQAAKLRETCSFSDGSDANGC